jgi:hypothetical protein
MTRKRNEMILGLLLQTSRPSLGLRAVWVTSKMRARKRSIASPTGTRRGPRRNPLSHGDSVDTAYWEHIWTHAW